MRLFAAIELPESHRAELARWIARVRPGTKDVGWSRDSQLHITLRFLGETGDAVVADVCEAVESAAAQIAPFELKVLQPGAFPRAAAPRVLWLGVQDEAQGCVRWAQRAETLFDTLGFPPEDRPLVPHVTLARSRSARGRAGLREILARQPPRELPAFPVKEVVLFESRLSREGPHYTPLCRAALRG